MLPNWGGNTSNDMSVNGISLFKHYELTLFILKCYTMTLYISWKYVNFVEINSFQENS